MNKRRFEWKAVNAGGVIQHDVWEGTDISEIQARLRNKGYFPVSIQRYRQWPSLFFSGRPAVDWSHFARRLSVLLEAGIPLLQALEMINQHGHGLTLEQEQWHSVIERIEEGSDLSEALLLMNPVPNSFVLSMIRVGEYTGTLGKVLGEIADELDQARAYRQKMQAVLAYPLLLLLAVVVVLTALSIWVLPMYEKLFSSLNADLPYLTKVIFAVGRKLPFLLGSGLSLLVCCALTLKLMRPIHWRRSLERLFDHLPLFGRILRLRDLAQFSRILSRLLAAGIPLLEALNLTEGTLRCRAMLELTRQLVLNVREGKRMTPLLRESRIFPREGTEIIAVAEEAGQLERMLSFVNQLFRREFEEHLERLTFTIEPILILALAGLIGLVASGVMLPIFDLSSHLE